MRKVIRLIRKHPRKSAAGFAVVAFVALNAVCFLHARAMTHFAKGGLKTKRPEKLSSFEKAGVLLTGVRVPKPVNHRTPEDFGLRYETHLFESADGVQLEGWYIPHPKADGLCLLFHGYASCKASVLPEAVLWRELGYATFLVDFRGSGGSSGRVTTIGYREADDVAAAHQYAQERFPAEDLVWYGQSMGAVAILRAIAVYGVQPVALVVESPFDRLLSTAQHCFAAMGIPSFPFANLLVFWGGAQHGFSGFAHNPVEYASQVDCPVLLMNGAHDRRVTVDQAKAVFDQLCGPKRIEIFPDAGHEPCLASDPERWKKAVLRVLDVARNGDNKVDPSNASSPEE